ncbi:sugar ABC transporter substrate-binding protein [Lacticaseibacillus mingshuiensis]|uniref:sugar ABC transporter substrate-binding protein n=1 Tax=Lacticaseibacillus mingshuiensis TaxID=2799574 RepID=UPI00194F1A54|nr:extracellular solute-binding protein [Lacticaseibacillus mingshuiensis]
MKKFGKRLLSIGATVAAVLTLAACGNKSNSSSSDSTNFKGQNLKIGVWIGNDNEKKGMNDLISGFEKKTGAKVTEKVYTDFNTQIQADLAGHRAPDVWYMDSSMYPFFQKQGVLQELNKKDVGESNFYPTLTKAYTTDGKLYGVPKDTSTLALYVNNDMFKKVGVSIDSIPKSYEDLLKWLPGFQAKLDKAYGKNKVKAWSYNQDLARNLYILERNGGKPIKSNGNANLSSDAVLKNLQLYKDLVATGAAVTPKGIGQGDNGTAFGAGKVAMMEEGNWTYEVQKQQYKTNFTVLPMLSYEGKQGGMIFTVGWGEYANSKVKPLATAWIKYVTSKNVMKKYITTTGTLPSRPDVAKAADLTSDASLKVHLDANAYSTVWQDGTTLVTVNTSYQNFVANGLAGKTTLKSAMKSADDQANAAIAKAK